MATGRHIRRSMEVGPTLRRVVAVRGTEEKSGFIQRPCSVNLSSLRSSMSTIANRC